MGIATLLRKVWILIFSNSRSGNRHKVRYQCLYTCAVLTRFVLCLFCFMSISFRRYMSQQTNKMTCAPSKDSDQPGHPPSLIRLFHVCLKNAWVPSYPLGAELRLDQTGRMPRLIWVFAGRTCHFLGFVMRPLIFIVNHIQRIVIARFSTALLEYFPE